MNKETKTLIAKTVFSLICFIMTILACCFSNFIQFPVLLVAIIGFMLLGVSLIVFSAEKFNVIYKMIILSIATLAICFIGYLIFYPTGIIKDLHDIEVIAQFIRSTNHWGIIVYILIVIFQVLFLPIPGIIPAFLGTALYGAGWAFVFMSIGTILGSLLAFSLGKIFGKKVVVWMVGVEKTEKYTKIFNDKGKLVFLVMLLFPFFPDDILCMVAGLTPMTYLYFFVAVTLTRPVMNAFYCFFGTGQIIPFTGWGIPVWVGLFVLAIVTLFFLNKLKGKISKKLLDKREKTIK